MADKWILAVAAAGALGSAGWFGLRSLRVPDRADFAVNGVAGAPYVAALAARDLPPRASWTAPRPQRRGAAWTFELFAPPTIFLDPQTQRFSAVAPLLPKATPTERAGAAPNRAGGVVLRSVQRVPYRLQLVGYAGEANHEFGLFEDTATGATFLARAAGRIDGLGLRVDAFSVSRAAVAAPEGGTLELRIATARVRDERTGKVTSLSDEKRCLTDELTATLAAAGESATTRDVREGGRVALGGAVYFVRSIREMPATIELAPADAAAGGRGTLRLTLDPADGASAAASPSFSLK